MTLGLKFFYASVENVFISKKLYSDIMNFQLQ